jgi:phage shock protein A
MKKTDINTMEDIKERAEGLQNKVQLWQTVEPNEKELRDFSHDYLALQKDIRELSSKLDKMYYSYQQMYARWSSEHDSVQQSSSLEWLKQHQLEINF